MSDPDYRPSQVRLGLPVPLVGTMNKAEAECAAACLVRVCQVDGDAWKPVSWLDVQRVMRADFAAKREPFFNIATNPFLRPDVFELVQRGFAEWADENEGDSPEAACRFTPAGFEAMRRHVHSL